MSYVTVFLRHAKKHTAIPIEYVADLDDAVSRNNGINRNQNRRIFFSGQLFSSFQNGETPNLLEHPPNFNLPITKEYPLPNGLQSTCFVAHLCRYWCE